MKLTHRLVRAGITGLLFMQLTACMEDLVEEDLIAEDLVEEDLAEAPTEEAVMDIHAAAFQFLRKLIGQNLHIAGEDKGVDCVTVEKFQFGTFLGGFVFRRDREMRKGYFKTLCCTAKIFPVADDQGNVDIQFAGLVT